MKEKIKLSQAIFWIFFSTFIISGTNLFIFLQVKKYQKNKFISSRYQIKAIAQKQNEITLDVNYLAEVIGLSFTNPSNIFLFDENKAKEKLLACPFIKEARIKKIKPDCLFIDYEIRKPLASLYDLENVAIDEEGYIFPMNPFYPPMDLCKFYLNIEKFKGYEKLDVERTFYALDIYKKLKDSGFADLVRIKVLDTSRLELKSYGKKEILLFIEEQLKIKKAQKDIVFIFPIILRLALSNYLEQIGNYIALRMKILHDYENQLKNIDFENNIVKFAPKTIDLRLSKLAFIDQ
jgi:hypothetical protein